MAKSNALQPLQTSYDLRGLHLCKEVSEVIPVLDEAGVPKDFKNRLLAVQMVMPSVQQAACSFSPEPLSDENMFHVAAHRLVSDNIQKSNK